MIKSNTKKGLLLTAVYLLTVLKLFFPFIDYSLNQSYISEVLCENKNSPWKDCQGKCYLKIQLKKTAEEESSNSKTNSGNIKIEELPAGFYEFKSHPGTEIISSQFPFYIIKYRSLPAGIISPPPKMTIA